MKFGTFVRITDLSEAEKKFEGLSQSGFTACQLVYKPKTYNPDDAKIVRAAADKYSIEISAQFCGYYDTYTSWDTYYGYNDAGINIPRFAESRISYVVSALPFIRNLGITDVIIHAGFIPNDPFCQKYTDMLWGLRTIASRCRSMGLNLLLETGGESPVTLLRMIEDTGADNLFINFDPANIYMYGLGNPTDAVRVFGKYIRNIHGKDGNLPTSSRSLGAESPAGEGMVDFPTIFALLKKLGYDRYIIIEREITGQKQLEDILKAKDYFQKLWNN